MLVTRAAPRKAETGAARAGTAGGLVARPRGGSPLTPAAGLPAEVVGFRDGRALTMPYGALEGIGLGCRVLVADPDPVIYPDRSWLGRVINARGQPIDGGPPLGLGTPPYPLRASPPPAAAPRSTPTSGGAPGRARS